MPTKYLDSLTVVGNTVYCLLNSKAVVHSSATYLPHTCTLSYRQTPLVPFCMP